MYRKILVPMDGSETATMGLQEAIKLAKGGATLKAIHVINDLVLVNTAYAPQIVYDQLMEAHRVSGTKILENAKATARASGVDLQVELLDTVGGPADLIVEHAGKWGADLIVMGTHGRRGLHRLALGSDAELVLRSSPIPVLMVRSAPET